MNSRQATSVDISAWRPLIIWTLVFVIATGVQPLSLSRVNARGVGWECQAPAATDARPVGMPSPRRKTQLHFLPGAAI